MRLVPIRSAGIALASSRHTDSGAPAPESRRFLVDETSPAGGREPHAIRALDLLDALTAIKGRAQIARRRVLRVDRLSREHIAADLGEIDDQVSRMAALLRDLPGESGLTEGSESTDQPATGRGEESSRAPVDR